MKHTYPSNKNKISKSEKSKPTKSELGFQTIDIPIKLHSELKALSGIKKIMGQKHFIYELATEAVEEYVQKHKSLIWGDSYVQRN